MFQRKPIVPMIACLLTACDHVEEHQVEDIIVTVPSSPTDGFNPNHKLQFRFPEDFASERFRPEEMQFGIRMTICHPGGAIAVNDACANESIAIGMELTPPDIVERFVGSAAGFPGPYASYQPVGAHEIGLEERENQVIEGTDWLSERIFVGAFNGEPMFIYCKDSGNDFPNFCTMRLENGLKPPEGANFSLLTKATFPEVLLADWRRIASNATNQVTSRGNYIEE